MTKGNDMTLRADHAAGAAFIAFGLLVIAISSSLPFGNLSSPGSGFMPGYSDVQKAFQDEFTKQLQSKTFDAGPVVAATVAAIQKALSQ